MKRFKRGDDTVWEFNGHTVTSLEVQAIRLWAHGIREERPPAETQADIEVDLAVDGFLEATVTATDDDVAKLLMKARMSRDKASRSWDNWDDYEIGWETSSWQDLE